MKEWMDRVMEFLVLASSRMMLSSLFEMVLTRLAPSLSWFPVPS
jgi:hypothetical protein